MCRWKTSLSLVLRHSNPRLNVVQEYIFVHLFQRIFILHIQHFLLKDNNCILLFSLVFWLLFAINIIIILTDWIINNCAFFPPAHNSLKGEYGVLYPAVIQQLCLAIIGLHNVQLVNTQWKNTPTRTASFSLQYCVAARIQQPTLLLHAFHQK